MTRKPGIPMEKVFIGHLRWLQAQGPSYKRQASSCKQQASSLTRNNYLKVLLHKPGQRVKNRFNRKR